MLLQADPTVAYGIGMVPRSRLFLRQLRMDSPFNTYLHLGLPPGPICNPGLKSIQAVIDPVPPNRELFFVARGEGHHWFSETYDQHLANIERAHALQTAAADSESLRARPVLAARETLAAHKAAPDTARKARK